MMQAGQQWTTDEIRAEAERLAEQERAHFCPGADEPGAPDEIEDPELWPSLDPGAIHPGLIQDFISASTANSEADPAAVLGTFLTRLSVEVGRNPYMMIGDGQQHVNLIAAIAGPTGAGRKGTSAKPVERLFALAIAGLHSGTDVTWAIIQWRRLDRCRQRPGSKLGRG